jgi:hypothetical protein
MFRSSITLLLLSATAAAQDAPRVDVPITPNASCPIMGKKVSLPLFVDTELGRIWVCCKPCFKKILANVPKAHQTAYPAITEHGNEACPVTGTPIGEHAETITLQSHRFRVCCDECAAAARAHSQVTLARLLAPKLTDVGNTTCPVRGTPVAANTFVVVDDHLVHLADSKAIAEIQLEPAALLQKAKQIAAAQPPKPPHVPKPKPKATEPATPKDKELP